MQTPLEFLADGQVSQAITVQEAVLETRPNDPAAALFLMELLTVGKRFREARKLLDSVVSSSPEWPKVRRRFRRMLRLAHERERGSPPSFLSDPPRHAMRRWLAARAVRRDDPETATRLCDKASASNPHLFGHLDGREFDGLRDADDRFASVLEAFVGSSYVWIPFEQLRRVSIAPEEHILCRVLRPAKLRLSSGVEYAAYLPLIYPGRRDIDEVYFAGLDTDHIPIGDESTSRGELAICIGAKMMQTHDEELPLGTIRQLDFRASV